MASLSPCDSLSNSLPTPNFVHPENIKDGHKCGICLKILKDPTTTDCGHRFCKICILEFIESGDSKKCPGPINATLDDVEDCVILQKDCLLPDKAVSREICQYLVYCLNKDKGCDEEMKWKELPKHLEDCSFQKLSEEDIPEVRIQMRQLQKRQEEIVLSLAELTKRLVVYENKLETQDYQLKCIEEKQRDHDRDDQKSSQVERQVGIHDMKFEDIDLRFQLIEMANYDGVLLWKIKDYKRRKQEAKDGKTLSIYSQPFYTSRHGYKMCARAYLNGDGKGRSTHLSLFFVIMRGEFDALLPWPFQQKVTLMLLDQDKGFFHLADTFQPDQASSSFQRPTSEMNIASGCPKFVPLEVLEAGETYLKEDTIFLKLIVDTSNLVAP